jgi:hypothetical protein
MLRHEDNLLPLHEHRDVCPVRRTITLFHLTLLSMHEVNPKVYLRCTNIGMFALSCVYLSNVRIVENELYVRTRHY